MQWTAALGRSEGSNGQQHDAQSQEHLANRRAAGGDATSVVERMRTASEGDAVCGGVSEGGWRQDALGGGRCGSQIHE
eukprot:6083801-Pyramimonas_sp.AAC.1